MSCRDCGSVCVHGDERNKQRPTVTVPRLLTPPLPHPQQRQHTGARPDPRALLQARPVGAAPHVPRHLAHQVQRRPLVAQVLPPPPPPVLGTGKLTHPITTPRPPLSAHPNPKTQPLNPPTRSPHAPTNKHEPGERRGGAPHRAGPPLVVAQAPAGDADPRRHAARGQRHRAVRFWGWGGGG